MSRSAVDLAKESLSSVNRKDQLITFAYPGRGVFYRASLSLYLELN
jgi:hypothetical protein